MKRQIPLLFLLLGVVTLAARAQNGCVNSPENPTALLALVGGASALFARYRRRA